MRRELAAAALMAVLAACRAPSANAPPPPPAPVLPPPAAPAPRAPATGSSSAAARAAAPPAATPEGLAAWKRNHEGLDARAPVKDCLGCHEGTHIAVHRSHPFDADYASAAGLTGSSLRPPDQAQQRGARLPDGKLHCLSCHDPGSPWKSHVALPAGARVRAALAPGPDDGSGEASAAQAQAAPPPGSSVNTMPLCQSCHTYGD